MHDAGTTAVATQVLYQKPGLAIRVTLFQGAELALGSAVLHSCLWLDHRPQAIDRPGRASASHRMGVEGQALA